MNASVVPAGVGLSTRRFDLPGGLALTADLAGPAQGRPILLLHGGGQTRGAWRECMTLLAARGQRVIVPDLRGHGESDWAPDSDYALDAQVQDVLALIGMLPAKPVLVGASLGGLIGMTLAGEHPQTLQALVLVDVVPRVDSGGRDRIIGFMKAHAHGFVSLQEAADQIAAYLPHRKRRPDLTGIERNLRLGLDGRYYWHWDPKFFDSFETDLPTSQARYAAAVRRITVPTLMVRGMMSDLVREAGVREFRELCPHAEVADVSDATHMVVGDRNDAFTAAIMDFLGRV
jgi:pimeloyl-ACP methyl ester carboxylesterase